MKNQLLFIAFFIFTNLNAQIKITQIHLNAGSFMDIDNSKNKLSDFTLLAPGSSILSKDFSAYQTNGYYFSGGLMRDNPFLSNSSNFQSIQLGLSFAKCPKGTLRIGISNVHSELLKTAGFKYESYVVDTLISSQTGQMYYVDSTISNYYNGNYSNDQLRLDAAYIFEANAGKRWAFHAGLGLSIGMSYRSTTRLRTEEYIQPYSGFESIANSENIESETYGNFMVMGGSAYIPLGLNFKLGNKREFWKPFVIYNEFRPTIQLNSIPNNTVKLNVGFGSTLGLRYNLPSNK
jgi:hypothetical protein